MTKPKANKRRRSRRHPNPFAPGHRITPPAHPYQIERNPWRRSVIRVDINSEGIAHDLSTTDLIDTLVGNNEITPQNKGNVNLRVLKVEVWSATQGTGATPNLNVDIFSLVPSATDLASPPAGVGVIHYAVLGRLVDWGNFASPARVGWAWGLQQSSQVLPSDAQVVLCAIASNTGMSTHAYFTCLWNVASVAPPQRRLGAGPSASGSQVSDLEVVGDDLACSVVATATE